MITEREERRRKFFSWREVPGHIVKNYMTVISGWSAIMDYEQRTGFFANVRIFKPTCPVGFFYLIGILFHCEVLKRIDFL